MRSRSLIALGAALFLAHCPSQVSADDPPSSQPASLPTPLHFLTSAACLTEGGSSRYLPPGYFLTEPQYEILNSELLRLQALEISPVGVIVKEEKPLDSPKRLTVRLVSYAALVGFASGVTVSFLIAR
jgi:hypothetical protein